MRVWNGADPRLLCRKHLLAEHREIHALLNPAYYASNNPETNRFRNLGPRGTSLLILRHELIRVAMAVRWGVERHGRDEHVLLSKDPELHAVRIDHSLMSERASAALLLYERHALPLRPLTPYECQHFFRRLMRPLYWPPCTLDGGAVTPWHRDGIKASEYVSVGDRWQRSEYHHKHLEYPSH